MALLALIVIPAHAGNTERVSVSTTGTGANKDSRYICAVSDDGRYVAFASDADNLVSGDTNGYYDIFRRDRQMDETILVSKSTAGVFGSGASYWPAMSGDGRYIAFFSYSGNLVSGDNNNMWDVFVHDCDTGTTELVSKSTGSTLNNGMIDSLAISDDGTVVAFAALATNLVSGDSNATWDIFTHNRVSGDTTRVSLSAAGTEANGPSYAPSLSEDGRYVSFESYADNLVTSDTNGRSDIFVKDTQTGAIERVSLKDDDTQVFMGDSLTSSISDDGRYIAFMSLAFDLVPGDVNQATDIFLRDRQAGTTTRVTAGNAASWEPAISGDGRYISFISPASNLGTGDNNGCLDVFRYDAQTASTILVSQTDGDTATEERSYARGISDTGRYVPFLSYSANIVPGDSNGTGDIFLRDIDGSTGTPGSPSGLTPSTGPDGTTTRLSESTGNTQADSPSFGQVSLGDHGAWAAFSSTADNLVPGDSNGASDIFLWTFNGSLESYTPGADGPSYAPAMGSDSRVVAFISDATNLVADDNNGLNDVFVAKDFGLTELISISTAGEQSDGPVDSVAVSANNEIVAFASLASNLADTDTNNTWDIFVRDRAAGTTEQITHGNGPSLNPSVSSDGRYVAFDSMASDLVTGDNNGRRDIFVYDRVAATTTRVSVTQSGTQHFGGSSYEPEISADGNWVVFTTLGWDLFPDDFNASSDIVLHELATGAITRISRPSAGDSDGWSEQARISADGNYVAFSSDASNLITGDTNGAIDVFRYSRSGTIERWSVTDLAEQSGDASFGACIDGDGDDIAFLSLGHLVPDDSNGVADVFIRRATAETAEIKITGNATEIPSGDTEPALADGTDYGRVSLSGSLAHSFTIENTGSGAYLYLTGSPVVEVTGAHAADFTVTTTPAAAIGPNNESSFAITFDPSAEGLRTATVTIANIDDDEGSYTFAVQGIGGVPEIQITGNGLDIADGDAMPESADGTDIGVLTLGEPALGSTFTIHNLGDVDLLLTGTPVVAISGADAADFSVLAQPSSPVAAAGSQSFVIEFLPSTAGLREATVTIANDDPEEAPFSFAIQGTGNQAPIADATTTSTNVRAWDTVTLSGAGSSDPDGASVVLTYSWAYISGPMTPGPTLTNVSGDWEIASFVPEAAGTYVFELTVSDGYASDTDQVTIEVTTRQRLVTGMVLASSSDWLTVGLPYDYHDMVAVCIPQYAYDPALPALTTRVRNATGASFELKLQRCDGDTAPVSDVIVHFIAVEAGAYNDAQHGIDMEAVNYLSSTYSNDNDWGGSTQHAYSNTYTEPAVIGQVMSTNDERFQVFWASNSSRSNPPSSTTLYTGRHIGEDPDEDRLDETIGFIVFESGAQSSDGVNLLAGRTDEDVEGIQNRVFTEDLGGFVPRGVVISANTMNGGNGGFPVLVGPNAFDDSFFQTAYDEDTLGDGERSHIDEAVGYVAFDVANYPQPIAESMVLRTDQDVPVDATVPGLNLYGSEVWDILSGPDHGVLSGIAPNLTYTPNSGFTGQDLFTFRITEDGRESNIGRVKIRVVPENPYLISGIIAAGTETWTTVPLPRSFSSMVVVCTPSYERLSNPSMTARVRNATGSSFEVRILRADAETNPLGNVPVHYVVCEEGDYNTAQHGITMEARKYTSTTFNESRDFNNAEEQTYINTYSNPVVVGQVMSINSLRHQMFWAMDGNRHNPPSGTALYTGRHIGEDPDETRPDETIGYIVFEAGSGIVQGLQYEIGLTDEDITHNQTSWPLDLAAQVAVLSSAGMNGTDGGYPILMRTPLYSNGFALAMEEDTLRDSDSYHVREVVAYAVFDSSHHILPFAYDQQISAVADVPANITLRATAMLSSSTWQIVAGPSNGTLSGTAPDLTYTPNAGFTGDDSFTVTATNDIGTSNTATISLNVMPRTLPNLAPQVTSVWAEPDPDAVISPASLEAAGWDPNDDDLTFTWEVISGPGTVTFEEEIRAIRSFDTRATTRNSGSSYKATFSELGYYELRVTASDGSNSTTTDFAVTVTEIETAPPVGGGSGGGGGGCSTGGTAAGSGLLLSILILGMVARRRNACSY